MVKYYSYFLNSITIFINLFIYFFLIKKKKKKKKKNIYIYIYIKLLYQKFGFKAEEFNMNFYEKYLPADSIECKNAFLLRLRR